MCGRFSLTADPNQLRAMFPWLIFPEKMQPRYNVAPSQPVAVVPNDGKNSVDFFLWGLIPFWSKDPNASNRMINARAETLTEKPTFKNAFKYRRCLILADGFYEWKSEPDRKSKTPMYIKLKNGHPFAFAGLWDIWRSSDGSEIPTCTIITTEPNELMMNIHNRMPVILHEKHYPQWLETNEPDQKSLQELLQPYPSNEMVAFQISRSINNPANDSAEVIKPI